MGQLQCSHYNNILNVIKTILGFTFTIDNKIQKHLEFHYMNEKGRTIMPLACNRVTLFAVVQKTKDGQWAFVAKQDNYPMLFETDEPESGSWKWSAADSPQNFSGAPTTRLETDQVQGGQRAYLILEQITAYDFATNRSGYVDVKVQDGDNRPVVYRILVNLRSLPSIDFTAREGQEYTRAIQVSAPPPDGGDYVFTVDHISHPGLKIGFSSNGKIRVDYAGAWKNVNCTFSLIIKDNSGAPASIFDGSRSLDDNSLPTLKLRQRRHQWIRNRGIRSRLFTRAAKEAQQPRCSK